MNIHSLVYVFFSLFLTLLNEVYLWYWKNRIIFHEPAFVSNKGFCQSRHWECTHNCLIGNVKKIRIHALVQRTLSVAQDQSIPRIHFNSYRLKHLNTRTSYLFPVIDCFARYFSKKNNLTSTHAYTLCACTFLFNRLERVHQSYVKSLGAGEFIKKTPQGKMKTNANKTFE